MQEVYVKLKLEPTPKLIPRNVTIDQRIEDAEVNGLHKTIRKALVKNFGETKANELMDLIL